MTLKNALISLATLLTVSTAYGQDHNIVGRYYSFIKTNKNTNQNTVTFHIAENLKHSNNLKDCQSTLKKITDSLEQIEFDTEKQNLFQVTYSSYINKDPLMVVLNTCEITIAGNGVSFKKMETDVFSLTGFYDYLPEQDSKTLNKVMALRSQSKNVINLFQTKHSGVIGNKVSLDYVQVVVD